MEIPFPQINVHITLRAQLDNPLVTNSFPLLSTRFSFFESCWREKNLAESCGRKKFLIINAITQFPAFILPPRPIPTMSRFVYPPDLPPPQFSGWLPVDCYSIIKLRILSWLRTFQRMAFSRGSENVELKRNASRLKHSRPQKRLRESNFN